MAAPSLHLSQDVVRRRVEDPFDALKPGAAKVARADVDDGESPQTVAEGETLGAQPQLAAFSLPKSMTAVPCWPAQPRRCAARAAEWAARALRVKVDRRKIDEQAGRPVAGDGAVVQPGQSSTLAVREVGDLALGALVREQLLEVEPIGVEGLGGVRDPDNAKIGTVRPSSSATRVPTAPNPSTTVLKQGGALAIAALFSSPLYWYVTAWSQRYGELVAVWKYLDICR